MSCDERVDHRINGWIWKLHTASSTLKQSKSCLMVISYLIEHIHIILLFWMGIAPATYSTEGRESYYQLRCEAC